MLKNCPTSWPLYVVVLCLAACSGPQQGGAGPGAVPTPAPLLHDEAELQARALAETGIPSPTPELDTLVSTVARITPDLKLSAILAGADAALPPLELRAGDGVQVMVYGRPEFSGEHTVAPDGTIHLFLLGTVRVAEMTPQQAAAALRKALEASSFLKRAEVFVGLTTRSQTWVEVVGQVRSPGLKELPTDRVLSVNDLLSKVEGFEQDADSSGLALVRRDPKGARRCYHFTYDELLRAHLAGQEAWLEPGDQLVVPRLAEVYVLGYVKAPGPTARRRGSTVATVLFGAGGLTPEGDQHGLRIFRGSTSLEASLGAKLEARDVLFVPRRQRVYLVGPGVVKQGPLDLPRSGLTPVQAIAESGWFSAHAKLDAVEILRQEGGRQIRIPVPVQQILDGEVSEKEFSLRPGDLIFVPESFW